MVMVENNLRNKVLDWMEERISNSDDFFLPLKKLRGELGNGLSIPVPPLEKLQDWLEEDPRFEVFPVPEKLGGGLTGEEAGMEPMGFFPGPRIGLKSRKPSPEQIAEQLKRHADNLLDSLQKAYASRPRRGPDSGLIEDRLLELLQKAQKFKDKLPTIIEED